MTPLMTPLTVAQAQHLNRTKSIHLAFRLSDAALALHVVCIRIHASHVTIQLGSGADAATVASRLGQDAEPVMGDWGANVHYTYEHDVDGIVVRVVGLDPIGAAS